MKHVEHKENNLKFYTAASSVASSAATCAAVAVAKVVVLAWKANCVLRFHKRRSATVKSLGLMHQPGHACGRVCVEA